MNNKRNRSPGKYNLDRRKLMSLATKMGVSGSLLRASSLIGGLVANRLAHAEDLARNIIFVYLPHGAPPGHWLPHSLESMNTCTEPYQGLAEYIAFREARQTNLRSGLPQFSLGATSWAPQEMRSSSINMQMAKVIGHLTPFPSLQLGVRTGSANGANAELVSQLNGKPVVNIDDPNVVFEKLFKSFDSNGTATQQFENPQNFTQERSVLNLHRVALEEIKNKLGQDERINLEQHFDSIERLEQRLRYQELESLELKEACNNYPKEFTTDSVIGTFRSQSDLACAALNCGLTRIISIQIANSGSSWSGENSGEDTPEFMGSHHEACHQTDQPLLEMTTYLSKCVAYLINQLKQTQLLNNTILVQVTDDGDCRSHSPTRIPCMVASQVANFQAGIGHTPTQEDVLADAVIGMGLDYAVGTEIADYGLGSGVFNV